MDAVTDNGSENLPASEGVISKLEDLRNEPLCAGFVERIPISFARRFGVIGLQNGEPTVKVAMSSVDNLQVLDTISVQLGLPAIAVLSSAEEITGAINRAYSTQESRVETVIENIHIDSAEEIIESLSGEGDLLDNDAHAPVVKLVNMIFFEAIRRRASDVHIQPFEDRLQVRLRIDGVLYDYIQPPKRLQEEIASRIKVIGKMDIAEKRIAQDGRTTVSLGERVVDLRISSLPTSFGERIVVRLLDKSARLYRLKELGLSDRDLNLFRSLAQRTHGIILVTGPTGSGKSTTLYATLQELDSKQLNILTLEDPIEYQLPGISQTQVTEKKGMTFASGLRTVLRQDPDVIMVGEIRDEETARMAVQSALTGHLVFSTLHTNDAAGAVTRLLDLGIEPYLVASSLLAVLAQRLVRCICPNCKTTETVTIQKLQELGLQGVSGEREIAHGAGCDKCLNTGYYERRGVFELLEVDESIRSLILQRAEAAAIKKSSMNSGMTTLRQDATDKMLAGCTTLEEVTRVTDESAGL